MNSFDVFVIKGLSSLKFYPLWITGLQNNRCRICVVCLKREIQFKKGKIWKMYTNNQIIKKILLRIHFVVVIQFPDTDRIHFVVVSFPIQAVYTSLYLVYRYRQYTFCCIQFPDTDRIHFVVVSFPIQTIYTLLYLVSRYRQDTLRCSQFLDIDRI